MNTFSAFVPFFCLNPITNLPILISSSIIFICGTLPITMTSQVLNQLTEKEHDKLMKRTENRPLALDKYSNAEVKKLAKGLTFTSFILFSPLYFFNFFPIKTVIMSYSVIGIYNYIYTPLKRYSNLSMHVGALSGAIVPLLGSIAITGKLYNPISLIFGIFIFSWQYPHFYPINYRHRQCYSNAGFEFISKYPMHDTKAKYHIFIALIVMAMCAIKLYTINKISFAYLALLLICMLPLFKFLPNFLENPKSLLIACYPVYTLFTLGLLNGKKN